MQPLIDVRNALILEPHNLPNLQLLAHLRHPDFDSTKISMLPAPAEEWYGDIHWNGTLETILEET